jgi:hypothetical protein
VLLSIEKDEVKSLQFGGDISLNVKDPKDSNRRLIDLINTFNKVVNTKSIHKNH